MWLYCIPIAVAIGYLLGSIPTGYIVGRRYGIDVREHGSGNIGATNVRRVLGKVPGCIVFVCDALKGTLAVYLARHTTARIFLSQNYSVDHVYSATHTVLANYLPIVGIIAALACILGHNFPVWLGFRGGKGVATTIGTLLGLMPLAFPVVAVVWIIAFYTIRFVSVASIVAATSLPVVVLAISRFDWTRPGVVPLFWFAVVAAGLVWWRHRGNIQRLRAGTEPRFDRKAKA